MGLTIYARGRSTYFCGNKRVHNDFPITELFLQYRCKKQNPNQQKKPKPRIKRLQQKMKGTHIWKKKRWEKRENLGEVDNEVPEIGMQASLLLKPIGNGFVNGFESEGSQLHHWVLWKTPKEPTMESHWNWTHLQTQTIKTSITEKWYRIGGNEKQKAREEEESENAQGKNWERDHQNFIFFSLYMLTCFYQWPVSNKIKLMVKIITTLS